MIDARGMACLFATLFVGCVGRYHYVDYLPFTKSKRAETTPEFVQAPITRRYRELGLFEAFARAHGVEQRMREDILERAGEVGCDAVLEVAVPAHAVSPDGPCKDPRPMIRAVCLQWL